MLASKYAQLDRAGLKSQEQGGCSGILSARTGQMLLGISGLGDRVTWL